MGGTKIDEANHATIAGTGTAVHGANNPDSVEFIGRTQAATNDEGSKYLCCSGTSSHEGHSKADMAPQFFENDHACESVRNTSTVWILD